MSSNVAAVGERAPPVQPAIDPSAVILLLLDSTTADLQATAPPAGPTAPSAPAPTKGSGLDFYA